jgi:hypothetical protein
MIYHYAEWNYAECRIFFSFMLSVIVLSVVMLSVFILSVIMLSVVAPRLQPQCYKTLLPK